MSPLYLEIFDKTRLEILSKFGKFPAQLVLGGGSALSLQIGHRKSYDFVAFYPKPLSSQFFSVVTKIFGENLEKLIDTEDQLSIILDNQIEITFLHYYYSALFPLVSTEFIPFYDIRDIALDKAHTIGRRGVWRDYVDLYFLLKDGHITLKDLLSLGKKKFGPAFAPKLFLAQLTYFGDIQDFTVEYIRKEYKPKKIQEYFKTLVQSYLKFLK